MRRHSTGPACLRRALSAAALALAVAAMPASAQPTPAERVLIDAVLSVHPPDAPGLCFPLGPGLLTVTARRTNDPPEPRPAVLRVDAYQDDPTTHLALRVLPRESTLSARVGGSLRYCWAIEVAAPETDEMTNALRGAYVQTVELRIVHRPD